MAMLNSIPVHLDSGRMTVGYYLIEDGDLVMLDNEGEEARRHTLRPGDNAKALAAVFTKEIRSRMVSPFWDDMKMPENGIA